MSTDGGRAGRGRGYDYEGGSVADYTPANTVSMNTQDQLNVLKEQNPGIPANTPEEYYAWLFGPGKVVPSSNTAQDPNTKYFAPDSGDAVNTRYKVPTYTPDGFMDKYGMQIALMAAGGMVGAGMAGWGGATGLGAGEVAGTAGAYGVTDAAIAGAATDMGVGAAGLTAAEVAATGGATIGAYGVTDAQIAAAAGDMGVGAEAGGWATTAGAGATAATQVGAPVSNAVLSSLGPGATTADLLKAAAGGMPWMKIGETLLGYGLNQQTVNSMLENAQKAASLNNPMEQPQRKQYQDQFSQLMSNPADFYKTNPAVRAQLDLAKQQFEANSAKMGTGGTQFTDYLRNVQNAASGTFNTQAKILGDAGGFNQGTGGAGSAFASGANTAAPYINATTYQPMQNYQDIAKGIFGAGKSMYDGFSLG